MSSNSLSILALYIALKKSIILCSNVFCTTPSFSLPSIASWNRSATASSCTMSLKAFSSMSGNLSLLYILFTLSRYVYCLSTTLPSRHRTFFLVLAAFTRVWNSCSVNNPNALRECSTS